MRYSYPIDDLTGTPSKSDLAITRKHSMRYDFVRHAEKAEIAGETPRMTAVRDVSSQRKREARQRPHSTSDLANDNGLRERRALLNGITRKHSCAGKAVCKCGKLAAKPSKGIGMAGFMRNVVRQGKRRYHRVSRALNSHNRAGALLASITDNASLKACAPLLRNHVRIVKAKDRGLV
jgi:hypothetical protein